MIGVSLEGRCGVYTDKTFLISHFLCAVKYECSLWIDDALLYEVRTALVASCP